MEKTKHGRGSQIFLTVMSIFWLAAGSIPYESVKDIFDNLAADGKMERLTPQFYQPLRMLFLLLAALHLGLLLWNIFGHKSCATFFTSILSLPKRFLHNRKRFFSDLASSACGSPVEWIILLLIMSAGILVRVLVIQRPLLHDEAYSIVTWGSADFSFAISDYHLPNNHLFHTVLINLIYHHIGKSVALMRLPVFICGVLLIPAIWLLGKRLYNVQSGLLAAGLTAFAPYLIDYSSNARGYEIQAFLTALSLLLAVYVQRKKNIFAWVMLIITSALNFYTLPIALYPFGGICIWFFFHVIFNKCAPAYKSRWNFFKYLITCGLSTSLLCLLFYSPLFIASGLDSFFGNMYVGPVPPGEFWQTSLSRLTDNYHAFCDTLPVPVWSAIFAGNILLWIFYKKISQTKIPYLPALALFMAAVMAYQKPNLWPRTLLFMHPLVILWGCAGLFFAINWLCGLITRKNSQWLNYSLAALLIIFAGASQVSRAILIHESVSPDETAVHILQKTEGANAENVLFVTAAQDNAPIWFYADCAGLPGRIFDKTQTFNTIYAYVNPLNDAYNGPKTLFELLDNFGPGNVFIRSDTQQILMDEPDGILYRFAGNLSAIEKAYGSVP